MALDDVFLTTRPNARNGGADPLALLIEQYSGLVEGTINRRSVTAGWIPMKTLTGTSTLRDDGVGGASLQVITPGATPDGSGATQWGKNLLTIEKQVLARQDLPMLDVVQSDRDKMAEIAEEHGKKISRFLDEGIFIQAIKASQSANSMFYNGTELPGHSGGSTVTFAGASDHTDPALFVSKLIDLIKAMEKKDVDPRADGLVLTVGVDEFWTLMQAEQLINADYITATGNKVVGGTVLKAYGIPVVSSNNYAGGKTFSGHLLSTANNGNGFDGVFTKVKATLFSPRAVLAAQNMPVASDIFFDKKAKLWFMDSWFAMSAKPRRTEFAGSLLAP